ncbi:MAG: hypothetical protein M1835_004699 [Candelina submexicana]|nr:MAG: hypothetical protein M1835_004699 [Candelina submexicana]
MEGWSHASKLTSSSFSKVSATQSPTLSTSTEIFVISSTVESIPSESARSTGTKFDVEVGGEGKMLFKPNWVNAAIGDIIDFRFLKLNHTLTESSLEHPCISVDKYDTGFSQFNPTNGTDQVISYYVQDDSPKWFFCRQMVMRSHCTAGMVFSINPGNSMEKFIQNARHNVSHSVIDSTGQIPTGYSVGSPTSGSSEAWIGHTALSLPTNPVGIFPIGATRFTPSIGMGHKPTASGTVVLGIPSISASSAHIIYPNSTGTTPVTVLNNTSTNSSALATQSNNSLAALNIVQFKVLSIIAGVALLI